MFTQEELKKMFNNGGINTKIENETNSVDAYLNKLKTYSNTKTELQNTVGGNKVVTPTTGAPKVGDKTIVLKDGSIYNDTTYATDHTHTKQITNIYKELSSQDQGNSISLIDNFIKKSGTKTPFESEQYGAGETIVDSAERYGVDPLLLTAFIKQESLLGTSNVAKKNNNFGGITWSQSYQDSHPNVSKGTARPISENRDKTKTVPDTFYVKFNSVEDGLDAVAEQLVDRITPITNIKNKATEVTTPIVVNTQKLEGDVDNIEKEITPGIDYIPSDNILKNIGPSFVQQFKDFGDIFTNPKQTIKSFSTLGNTIVDYLDGNGVSEQSQAIKDGLLNYYKERYGGIDNLKRTISQDPAGFASDASMVLSIIAAPFTGGASLLANLGIQSKTVASVLKTAKVIDNVADIIDPVTGTFKGIKKGTKFVNKLAKTDVAKTLGTLEDVVSDKYTNAFKIKDNTLLSKKLTNNYLDLIKDGYVGTIDDIRKQADKNLDVAKNVYNSNNLKGKLNLVLNNKKLESLYNIIESKIDDMLDDSGNVKSGMESQYKTMQDMYNNIKSSKNPTYGTLNEYKQQWADMVYGKKGEKTPVFPSGSEYNAAQARLEMADILNDFLTDNVSELADANKKWNNALTAKALADSTATYMEKITESQKRQKGYLVPTILGGIGTGIATQNPLAALGTAGVVFIGANAFEYFKKVVGNATKGTMSAQNYNNIVQFFDKYFTPTMADRLKDLKTWDEQIKFINGVVQDTRRVVTKQSKAEENNFMNQKNQSIKPPVNSKGLFGSVKNEKVDLFKSVK